jgi:assimilatory nitrate reductase catalytic subunit
VTPRPPVHVPIVTAPLRLNTGRIRDQWHTMTRTGKSPRLAGHRPEPFLELRPDDAAARGLTDGDIAQVASAWGRATLRVRITASLRPGDAYAPMHWTARMTRAGRINAAVNPAVDPISGQPEFKHTPIEVERVSMRWHGTILARRAVMIPNVSYWTKVRGVGFYAYVLAGGESRAAAQQALAAALRATNPGPWLQGNAGVSAVIADGHVEAILALGERADDSMRDRLSVFMRSGRLSVDERTALLEGGPEAARDGGMGRGGEVCACFGVSCSSVERAISCGAVTLDQVGAATKAGTNCGSCRPDIRVLLRAARPRKAA